MPSPETDRERSRETAATRPCAARGCPEQVPRRRLMCRTHWFQVPADVRASIWLAYRPGQESNGNPSRAYINAVTEAIDLVARHGRRP